MKKLSLFLTILLIAAKCFGQGIIPVKISAVPVHSVDSGSYGLGVECAAGVYTNCRFKIPGAVDTTWLSNRINGLAGSTPGLSDVLRVSNIDVAGAGLYSDYISSGANIQSSIHSGSFTVYDSTYGDGIASFGFDGSSGGQMTLYNSGNDAFSLKPNGFGSNVTVLFPYNENGTMALLGDSAVFASRFRVDSGIYNMRTYVQNWGLDQVLSAGNTSSHSVVLSSGAYSANIQNFNISMFNGALENSFVFNGFQYNTGTYSTSLLYATPTASTTINVPALSAGTYTLAVTSQIEYHTNSTQVLTGAATATIAAASAGSHCICGIESSSTGTPIVSKCSMTGGSITVSFSAPVTSTVAMSVVYW